MWGAQHLCQILDGVRHDVAPTRSSRWVSTTIRVEVPFRYRAGGLAMAGVVRVDRLETGKDVRIVVERQQPFASRNGGAETRVLREHRPACREIAGAPVAEPIPIAPRCSRSSQCRARRAIRARTAGISPAFRRRA